MQLSSIDKKVANNMNYNVHTLLTNTMDFIWLGILGISIIEKHEVPTH